jgi:hypothetical protein
MVRVEWSVGKPPTSFFMFDHSFFDARACESLLYLRGIFLHKKLILILNLKLDFCFFHIFSKFIKIVIFIFFNF